MTITQVMAQLQNILEDHGDLDVCLDELGGMLRDVTAVTTEASDMPPGADLCVVK